MNVAQDNLEAFLDIADEFHIKGLERDKKVLKSNSLPTQAKEARSTTSGKLFNIFPQPQDHDNLNESHKTLHFEDNTDYVVYDDEDYSNPSQYLTVTTPNPIRRLDEVKVFFNVFHYFLHYIGTQNWKLKAFLSLCRL